MLIMLLLTLSPQYLGRSLSTGLGPDSDRGYDSYRAGTCR